MASGIEAAARPEGARFLEGSFRTVVLRHVPFEDLGVFGPPLRRRGSVEIWEIGLDDLAALDGCAPDLVISLGGPVGVGDGPNYPQLVEETRLIARRIEAGRPTLGICLGAQLIASASGAAVRAMGAKEIGFAPITLTEAGRASCLAPYAEDPLAFLWHGDMVDLPAGATLLASSALCAHQAFAMGPHVLGFQFHPEVDLARIEAWLIGHAVELSSNGVDVPRLRQDARRHAAAHALRGARVLERWLDGHWR